MLGRRMIMAQGVRTDPNFANMIVGTTLNGINGNQGPFVDLKGHTLTPSGGVNPVFSNAQVKWPNYATSTLFALENLNVVGVSLSLTDFYFSAWLYLTSYVNTNRFFSTATTGEVSAKVSVTTGNLEFEGGSGSFWNIATGNQLPLNAWGYVECWRSGSSVLFYLNGTQIGSTTNSTSITVDSGFRIGADGSGSNSWSGYMQDFRSYTVVPATAGTVPTRSMATR